MKGKLFPGVLMALSLLMAGCGEKVEKYGALDAAVVPGADLTVHVDYDSIRKSPAGIAVLRYGDNGATGVAGEKSEGELQLEKATGLTRESLVALSFSGDLDELDPDSAARDGDLGGLRAATALLFDRALTEKQVEAGLKVLLNDSDGAVVSGLLIEGRRTFTLSRPGDEPDTLYVALSKDGRAVFLAPNSVSISELFTREESQERSDLPPALESLRGEMGNDVQFRSAFVMPAALRGTLDTKIADLEKGGAGNPGIGMVLGLAAPFRGLTGLTMGARFTEKIDFSLAADLGGESDALQAAALLQTMVLPVIGARLFQVMGVPAGGADRLTAVSEGNRLIVRAKLEAADLTSIPPL
ncbi:hypothetical protein ACFL2P_03120 [Candidatus Moduliflexota bacterium]